MVPERKSAAPDAIDLRDDLEEAPNSRVYVHSRCGAGTMVTDGTLRWMTNPLRTNTSTVCAGCGEALLPDVRWADSGESVADFRARMNKLTPLWVKFGHYVLLPLVWAVIAFPIFILVWQNDGKLPLSAHYSNYLGFCLV